MNFAKFLRTPILAPPDDCFRRTSSNSSLNLFKTTHKTLNKFLVLSDLEKVERIRNFRSAKNRFLETEMRRQLIHETYFAFFFQNNNTKSLTRKINTLTICFFHAILPRIDLNNLSVESAKRNT